MVNGYVLVLYAQYVPESFVMTDCVKNFKSCTDHSKTAINVRCIML